MFKSRALRRSVSNLLRSFLINLVLCDLGKLSLKSRLRTSEMQNV